MTAVGSPSAGRREWIGLAVIALPCLLYSMDLTVLYLALPSLTADLKPSSAQLLWITDIYGFMLAGFLITMGTLGDRVGRRRLLLIGAAAFGVASVLAASAPLLGGLLLHFFWWGSVFLLAIPVMALLLVLGPLLLPEFRDPDAGRFDLVSTTLSLVSVLALVYGVKELAQNGFGPVPEFSFLGGLAVGLAFLRRQRKLAEPLIDLQLFRTPAFTVSQAANTLSLFLVFGSFFLIAQYLQLVLGLSPLSAGLWTVPSSLGFIAGSLLARKIVRRLGPGITMAYGLGLAATVLRRVQPAPEAETDTELSKSDRPRTPPPAKVKPCSG